MKFTFPLLTILFLSLLVSTWAQDDAAPGKAAADDAPVPVPEKVPAAEAPEADAAEAPEAEAAEAPVLETPAQKVSYAIGSDLARTLGPGSANLDSTLIAQAIKDTLAGQGMDPDECRKNFISYMTESKKKTGKDWLAKNLADNEDIVNLPSGLQYKVVTKGEGAVPTADKTVTVHYTGTLVNGTKFDSSRDRGSPASFRVGGVIKGWTEALQLMPVGSRWMLYIPSDLAYGERGSPPRIGPHEVLVFDVELLDIK